jgi:hypothetical protein
MRSMVEGARRKVRLMRRAPSVSAMRCHLPVPGRIGLLPEPRFACRADGFAGGGEQGAGLGLAFALFIRVPVPR